MSKTNYLEDINLWKRILNDDREALSLLFKKFYKPLLNYGLYLVPERELVQDNIQELFLRIWKSRDRLSNIEYVRSYLYTSLRRSILEEIELQKNRQKRDRKYSDSTDFYDKNIEQRMIIEEIKQEEKESVRQALETLTDRQRKAAFLKFYGGLTNDEISEVMNVNKQSVYNYIYRAIVALQEELRISFTA